MLFLQSLLCILLTLIPFLQADNEGPAEIKQNMGNVVTKIIRVFVDAMPHVPEHRRVPVLSTLIDTVSAERFLWALLMLLFEQHVTKNASSATNGEKVKVGVFNTGQMKAGIGTWTVGCY